MQGRGVAEGAPANDAPTSPLMRYRAARRRAKEADGDERRRIVRSTQRARREIAQAAIERSLATAFTATDPQREELLWFWFNHFNVYWHKEGVGVALPGYLEALRAHLDAPFAELLRAASLHPAMLIYLDNENNRAARLNENQARELLELHTLGVEGGYGQRDVQELARVMTGFGVRPPQEKARRRATAGLRDDGDFRFDPRAHDSGTKEVLGAPIEPAGEAEFDRVVALLAAHPSTTARLARKLAMFAAGDDPPPALIDAAAKAWQKSEGRAAAVIAAILSHRALPRRPSFKDPRRWVLSATRLLAGPAVPRDTGPIARWMTALGQPPYGCRTPDGWSLRGADWLGAGQLTQRFELAQEIVAVLPRLLDEGAEAPAARLARVEATAAGWRPAEASRAAWARAADGDARLALMLSSPEFMHWSAG
jgi:uncharacterized protein (DUF1800 family)